MKISPRAYLVLFIILFSHQSYACSMYKVTADGKTMVGCNQDAWRTTTSIWFVNAENQNQYGVCLTGSRKVGPNKYTPQSAMNAEGLVFSRLSAYYPIKNLNSKGKKQITNEAQYLTDILLNCKNVKEVRDFVQDYDRSFFYEDVFIYIDQSGDYLVVEPYELIEGNDASYVLANFCPSITNNQSARKQTRYKDGEDFIKKNEPQATLDFCRSVSKAMHVCRKRNGDGTLLTSIWDSHNGLVNLYFYHNYDNTRQFNITEELAKGDHSISIPELFPINPEFERLADYKTPFNTPSIRNSLILMVGIIIILSLLFIINYFKKRNTDKVNFINLIFTGLNLLLAPYLLILATNKGIFYFDAPYKDYSSKLISMSSYIPFLLALLIIPIIFYSTRYFRTNSKILFIKSALIFNTIIYLLLITGFYYWGLFDAFN